MVTIEEVDAAFRAIGDGSADEEKQWNNFLNLLIQGGPLYAMLSLDRSRVEVLQSGGADGVPAMYAFTSTEAARISGAPIERFGFVTLNDFIKVVKADPAVEGVLVNGGPTGRTIWREILLDMDRFLTETGTRTVDAGTKRFIGEPTDYPQGLVDDLAREATKHPMVKRMWLRQMYLNNESSYLLVIDAPEPDEDVLRAFSVVIEAHPERTQPVDISMRPTQSLNDNLSGPFYKRKRRLFKF